jgi:hypothetical protein
MMAARSTMMGLRSRMVVECLRSMAVCSGLEDGGRRA